ncbi:MAG TPA: 5-(carboxyamino)imidazole ribonucleotide synthase [Chthoniobacterales bacterium]
MSSHLNSIPPGATIGLLGGGQLGRMFALSARKMGYRVYTFEPQPDSPAGQISDREFTANYLDRDALDSFATSVDVVTFEFENIPAEVVERVAAQKPVYPRWSVLHICQNREREKKFLASRGYPVAPFRIIHSAAELAAALHEIGTPCVLKTANFGYDGKGQLKISAPADPNEIWERFAARKAVLESWITHQSEVSAIVARNAQGETSSFPVAENLHRNHILDVSVVPARIPLQLAAEAEAIARRIAADLDLVGLLAVEFFISPKDELLVNELAPRPHNSGHYTFDACVTSQFEQQLRAVCSLPFSSTRLLSPVVMVNLLGDLWPNPATPPDFYPVLAEPDARLHLYGKSEGRKGRKMGHFCVLKPNVEEALSTALAIRAKLNS